MIIKWFQLVLRFLLLGGVALLVLSCDGQTDLSPNGDIANDGAEFEGNKLSALTTSIPVSSFFTGNKVHNIKRPEVSYLDRVVPPCTIQFGNQEPCSDKSPANLHMLSVHSSPPYWPYSNEIPTFEQLLIREGDDVVFTPHIVVRGIFIPDTTRCAPYPSIPATYKRLNAIKGLYHYHCFVDLSISEYIVGSGPSILTVSMHRENLRGIDINNWENIEEEVTQNLDNPRARTANAFEGRELVLFLDLPFTIAVESWDGKGNFVAWSVQRNRSNEIRAVAEDIRHARTDEQRARLNIPLDELIQKVKEAAATRMIITGGRIGKETDLPMLVTDANYLQDFYISEGAVYDDSEGATVLPPPIPGEGDPAAPTIPVNEGTTGNTLPVPGEETSVPPSTDDAGLMVGQETTTTSSTTTVVEVPVTTEIAPIVTTTAVTAEEPVVIAPDTTETVTGTTTTTTTTTVETESNGEDVVPSVDDDSFGGGPAASTSTSSTLSPTTPVVTPSGDDGDSSEVSTTTVPSENGVPPPAGNGGLGEQAEGQLPLVDES